MYSTATAIHCINSSKGPGRSCQKVPLSDANLQMTSIPGSRGLWECNTLDLPIPTCPKRSTYISSQHCSCSPRLARASASRHKLTGGSRGHMPDEICPRRAYALSFPNEWTSLAANTAPHCMFQTRFLPSGFVVVARSVDRLIFSFPHLTLSLRQRGGPVGVSLSCPAASTTAPTPEWPRVGTRAERLGGGRR